MKKKYKIEDIKVGKQLNGCVIGRIYEWETYLDIVLITPDSYYIDGRIYKKDIDYGQI